MRYHPLTYKCRIYPNERQIKQFQITLDSCHFLYNSLLKQYKLDYANGNKPSNLKEYFNNLTESLKSQYTSISSLDDSTINDVSKNILRAIYRKKDPNKLKPKDENRRVQSFLINYNQDFELSENKLNLGKYGKLKLHYGKIIEFNRIISFRILYQNRKWYILVVIRSNDILPFEKTGKKVGIDLGIKHLIILSNGKKFDPPDLSPVNEKIDKYNSKLSTKVRNSSNYELLIDKLNSAHTHRKNTVLDYYHKVSTQLVKEYDVIAMENLNIHQMIQNHKFSRNIYHANWYKLVEMIKYKCHLYGKTFIPVSEHFPSTQLCNNCGYQYKDITINERMWECPSCGKIHDRDVNAAKNILDEAKKVL
ncbi:MAG: hypothetical protein BZ135_05405 [Methanosphaera sp. rholeuAM6]|nr:MAG: hypothetical protein BZ135_05405 [Methanosphaera sp. rholeuAM6]